MTKYYKILREDLTHHGFEYELGLNVDILPFNPVGKCKPGGLYYTNLENIFTYISFGRLIAEVEPVGQIYEEKGKWKTDKLFIHSIVTIREWFENKTDDMKMLAVNQNGVVIKYIKNPSIELQLAAVKQLPKSITYIKKPSEEVQLAAVSRKGSSIKYIKNPSEEIQLAAVSQDGMAIQNIYRPSEKVWEAAAKQNLGVMRFWSCPIKRSC